MADFACGSMVLFLSFQEKLALRANFSWKDWLVPPRRRRYQLPHAALRKSCHFRSHSYRIHCTGTGYYQL